LDPRFVQWEKQCQKFEQHKHVETNLLQNQPTFHSNIYSLFRFFLGFSRSRASMAFPLFSGHKDFRLSIEAWNRACDLRCVVNVVIITTPASFH
jgi:hypothetical protein